MLKIGIITGSTRPNRQSPAVATWVLEIARSRSDAEYELVDIKDFELPLLDEPMPPSMGNYQQAHTKRWAAKIASLDAFVFVSPEYNHGIPAALKNAIDFLFAEWKEGRGVRELRRCGRREGRRAAAARPGRGARRDGARASVALDDDRLRK